MLDCVNGYWTKNEKKDRSCIMLIDNHISKCVYADKRLGSLLSDGDLESGISFVSKAKTKKNEKSKKVSKKSKKKSSKKRKKLSKKISDSIDRANDRFKTNSSEDELEVHENNENKFNSKDINKKKSVENTIFHYLYNEEHVNYKR